MSARISLILLTEGLLIYALIAAVRYLRARNHSGARAEGARISQLESCAVLSSETAEVGVRTMACSTGSSLPRLALNPTVSLVDEQAATRIYPARPSANSERAAGISSPSKPAPALPVAPPRSERTDERLLTPTEPLPLTSQSLCALRKRAGLAPVRRLARSGVTLLRKITGVDETMPEVSPFGAECAASVSDTPAPLPPPPVPPDPPPLPPPPLPPRLVSQVGALPLQLSAAHSTARGGSRW